MRCKIYTWNENEACHQKRIDEWLEEKENNQGIIKIEQDVKKDCFITTIYYNV